MEPSRWREAVVSAVESAYGNPVRRPVDPNKLKYRPRGVGAKISLVTVPASEGDNSADEVPVADQAKEPTTHTETQSLLLQLGSEMGFDIWSASYVESFAMQPNLNIPLYLVAPDERRDKVMEEVNRPTFSRLNPPLAGVYSYISFSALRERLKQVRGFVKYLKSDFLDELAEECFLSD
jgi:hypothetical protein